MYLITKGLRLLLTTSIFLIFLSNSIQAQDLDRILFGADKYFSIENYEKALPLYQEAVEAGADDAKTLYRLGKCYASSFEVNDKIKAIPYFEKALNKNKEELPTEVYNDLAKAYHLNEQLDEALFNFTMYKSKLGSNIKAMAKVDESIDAVNNAKLYMSNSKDIKPFNFGTVINSEYTEYNPVVSTDESVMAFTALRPNTGRTRVGDDFVEKVMISYNNNGIWSQPEEIEIVSDYNVGTAGLSPDGQEMMVFIGGAGKTGNLYEIKKDENGWSKPVVLSNKVNSKYVESTASITPDGKTMYFASNRPDGYGGFDIYKVEKLESGEWGKAENLGPKVNTKYDEDAPFIHPDQWSLFFTSNGHTTMGGRDIFVTRLFNDDWTDPENLGYPINTTADDNYFTLTADGRKGYFSSDRKGGLGGQDIYSIDMPEEDANIPLTMVKGRILDAETMKPIPTTIYMIDNESGKKLDFVYQPDPSTGNYLIILPPAKNYDMIIESEGFLPYTLNINVPGQTYFYELYQEILLRTIKQFDVVVGQEVDIKNAFYDTHEDAVTDFRKTHEAALVKADSIDVYELMNDLIAAEDEAGIEYLTDLIFMSNPIEDVRFIFSEKLEAAKRTYYYDESDESKFEKKVIDGNTILSLPTMYVTEEAEKQKNKPKTIEKTYDKELLNKMVKVYFDVAKSELKDQYKKSLEDLVAVLQSNPQLGVRISGYASSEGDEEYNRELSNKRAITVLDFINRKEIVRRRIIARGQGEASTNDEEGRRVEIEIVDLHDQGREVID